MNVRVISATNKNLLELVANKKFRGDLYYRLAVFPLDLPPLRTRRDDIPALVEHFLRLACQRHAKPGRKVTPDTLQALFTAPWPGNVRELKYVIERAVVTSAGTQLVPQDLPLLGGVPTERADLRTAIRDAAQSVERARSDSLLAGRLPPPGRYASAAPAYNKLRAYRISPS